MFSEKKSIGKELSIDVKASKTTSTRNQDSPPPPPVNFTSHPLLSPKQSPTSAPPLTTPTQTPVSAANRTRAAGARDTYRDSLEGKAFVEKLSTFEVLSKENSGASPTCPVRSPTSPLGSPTPYRKPLRSPRSPVPPETLPKPSKPRPLSPDAPSATSFNPERGFALQKSVSASHTNQATSADRSQWHFKFSPLDLPTEILPNRRPAHTEARSPSAPTAVATVTAPPPAGKSRSFDTRPDGSETSTTLNGAPLQQKPELIASAPLKNVCFDSLKGHGHTRVSPPQVLTSEAQEVAEGCLKSRGSLDVEGCLESSAHQVESGGASTVEKQQAPALPPRRPRSLSPNAIYENIPARKKSSPVARRRRNLPELPSEECEVASPPLLVPRTKEKRESTESERELTRISRVAALAKSASASHVCRTEVDEQTHRKRGAACRSPPTLIIPPPPASTPPLVASSYSDLNARSQSASPARNAPERTARVTSRSPTQRTASPPATQPAPDAEPVWIVRKNLPKSRESAKEKTDAVAAATSIVAPRTRVLTSSSSSSGSNGSPVLPDSGFSSPTLTESPTASVKSPKKEKKTFWTKLTKSASSKDFTSKKPPQKPNKKKQDSANGAAKTRKQWSKLNQRKVPLDGLLTSASTSDVTASVSDDEFAFSSAINPQTSFSTEVRLQKVSPTPEPDASDVSKVNRPDSSTTCSSDVKSSSDSLSTCKSPASAPVTNGYAKCFSKATPVVDKLRLPGFFASEQTTSGEGDTSQVKTSVEEKRSKSSKEIPLYEEVPVEISDHEDEEAEPHVTDVCKQSSVNSDTWKAANRDEVIYKELKRRKKTKKVAKYNAYCEIGVGLESAQERRLSNNQEEAAPTPPLEPPRSPTPPPVSSIPPIPVPATDSDLPVSVFCGSDVTSDAVDLDSVVLREHESSDDDLEFNTCYDNVPSVRRADVTPASAEDSQEPIQVEVHEQKLNVAKFAQNNERRDAPLLKPVRSKKSVTFADESDTSGAKLNNYCDEKTLKTCDSDVIADSAPAVTRDAVKETKKIGGDSCENNENMERINSPTSPINGGVRVFPPSPSSANAPAPKLKPTGLLHGYTQDVQAPRSPLTMNNNTPKSVPLTGSPSPLVNGHSTPKPFDPRNPQVRALQEAADTSSVSDLDIGDDLTGSQQDLKAYHSLMKAERKREQVLAAQEQQRLEDILDMCADFTRQLEEEKHQQQQPKQDASTTSLQPRSSPLATQPHFTSAQYHLSPRSPLHVSTIAGASDAANHSPGSQLSSANDSPKDTLLRSSKIKTNGSLTKLASPTQLHKDLSGKHVSPAEQHVFARGTWRRNSNSSDSELDSFSESGTIKRRPTAERSPATPTLNDVTSTRSPLLKTPVNDVSAGAQGASALESGMEGNYDNLEDYSGLLQNTMQAMESLTASIRVESPEVRKPPPEAPRYTNNNNIGTRHAPQSPISPTATSPLTSSSVSPLTSPTMTSSTSSSHVTDSVSDVRSFCK